VLIMRLKTITTVDDAILTFLCFVSLSYFRLYERCTICSCMFYHSLSKVKSCIRVVKGRTRQAKLKKCISWKKEVRVVNSLRLTSFLGKCQCKVWYVACSLRHWEITSKETANLTYLECGLLKSLATEYWN